MTDEEKFVELMNSFGIRFVKHSYEAITTYDVSDVVLITCDFEFDKNGKSFGICCSDWYVWFIGG